MVGPDTNPTESPLDFEGRLSLMEKALKIDERLASLEVLLATKAASVVPWWRDPKTVTILTALLAAVLPAVTAIDGIFKNLREAQRAFTEQQNTIRQNYLDRVLKAGVTESEQLRIFHLLSKFKGDPEFQDWAKEEYQLAAKNFEKLTQEKLSVEAELKKVRAELEQEKNRAQSAGKLRAQPTVKQQELERVVTQTERSARDLRWRVGEGGPSALPWPLSVLGSSSCTCPVPPGGGVECAAKQIASCTVQNGACIGKCLEIRALVSR